MVARTCMVARTGHCLKLRGTRRATLVMTRMRDQPWSLVCVNIDQLAFG